MSFDGPPENDREDEWMPGGTRGVGQLLRRVAYLESRVRQMESYTAARLKTAGDEVTFLLDAVETHLGLGPGHYMREKLTAYRLERFKGVK